MSEKIVRERGGEHWYEHDGKCWKMMFIERDDGLVYVKVFVHNRYIGSTRVCEYISIASELARHMIEQTR